MWPSQLLFSALWIYRWLFCCCHNLVSFPRILSGEWARKASKLWRQDLTLWCNSSTRDIATTTWQCASIMNEKWWLWNWSSIVTNNDKNIYLICCSSEWTKVNKLILTSGWGSLNLGLNHQVRQTWKKIQGGPKERNKQGEAEEGRSAAPHYTNGHLLWCPGLRAD